MKTMKKLLAVLLSVLMIGAMMVVFTACGDDKKSDDDKSTTASEKGKDDDNGLSKEQQKVIDKLADAMNDRDAEAVAELFLPLDVIFDVDTITDACVKNYENEMGTEVTEEEIEEVKELLEDQIDTSKEELYLQIEDMFEEKEEEYGEDWECSFEVKSVEEMDKDDIEDFEEEMIDGLGDITSYVDFEITDAVKVSLVGHLEDSEKSEDEDADDAVLYKCNGDWYLFPEDF